MSRTICLAGNTGWGMYNFRFGLINHLLANRFEVHVVVPPDDYAEKLRAAGCTVHGIVIDSKGKSPWADLSSLRRFLKIYRDISPDVVIHYTIKPVIYGAFAASVLKIPFVSVFTGLGSAFSSRNIVTWIVEVLYRWSQRNASAILFLNEADKENIVRRGLVPQSAVRTIPGEGIDLRHFAAAPYEEIPPATSPTIFLFAGRLLWEKGVGELIEAARIVKSLLPTTRFQLLGPCNVENASAISREQVRRWEQSGIIEYLGVATDVRPYLYSATCVVLPSFYREGVPRVLMEAAALERPIITTDMPGCRNVVDDGVSGLLIPPRDVAALAAACLKLASLTYGELRQMGQRGREKMEREFDERFVFAAYTDSIAQALHVR